MLVREVVDYPLFDGESEERSVFIYLPVGYDEEENKDKRYPVLYMFDGHNVFRDEDASFGRSWRMENYLDLAGTQLVVVGVESSRHPNNDRLCEYSPYTFNDEKFGYVEGHGTETMNWFVKCLKPMVDSNYRTIHNRRHTFIGGSSMGGLMSLFAITRYNRYFSRCLALSPSIWVNYKGMREMVKKSRMNAETLIYMEYGADEMKNHYGMKEGYNMMVESMLRKKAIDLTARIVPRGNHSEASWERQLPIAIPALMYGLE